jgi:hypothetical protein
VFKKGQKVKLKKSCYSTNNWGLTPTMKRLLGKTVTIIHAYPHEIRIKEDGGGYGWDPTWFSTSFDEHKKRMLDV